MISFFSFQVALNVGDNAFALIFGWNMFVALALQSILTLIVADQNGLDLSIRNQVTQSLSITLINLIFFA